MKEVDITRGLYRVKVDPSNAQRVADAAKALGGKRYGLSESFEINTDDLFRIVNLFFEDGDMTHSGYDGFDEHYPTYQLVELRQGEFYAVTADAKEGFTPINIFLTKRIAELGKAIHEEAVKGNVAHDARRWAQELLNRIEEFENL